MFSPGTDDEACNDQQCYAEQKNRYY